MARLGIWKHGGRMLITVLVKNENFGKSRKTKRQIRKVTGSKEKD